MLHKIYQGLRAERRHDPALSVRGDDRTEFSFVVLLSINAFLRLPLWRKVYRIKGFWHYGICNASSSSIEYVVLDLVVQKLWSEFLLYGKMVCEW